jgi:hypothetical protein
VALEEKLRGNYFLTSEAAAAGAAAGASEAAGAAGAATGAGAAAGAGAGAGASSFLPQADRAAAAAITAIRTRDLFICIPDKKIPEFASWEPIKPSPHSKYWVSSGQIIMKIYWYLRLTENSMYVCNNILAQASATVIIVN